MKKRVGKRFNISNRAVYGLLSIMIIVLAGVVVWAAVPNPGHSATEVDLGPLIINETTERVGIGLNNNYPSLAKLEIRVGTGTEDNAIHAISSSPSPVIVGFNEAGGKGIFGGTTGGAGIYGVYGQASGEGIGVVATSDTGTALYAHSITGPAAHLEGNGESLQLSGVDHSFISFYPDGMSAGRKAWIGFGDSATEDIYITSDTNNDIILNLWGGRVGVGTKNPGVKFDVNGDVRATGFIIVGYDPYHCYEGLAGALKYFEDADGFYSKLMVCMKSDTDTYVWEAIKGFGGYSG